MCLVIQIKLYLEVSNAFSCMSQSITMETNFHSFRDINYFNGPQVC